jgi:hypothetical protein
MVSEKEQLVNIASRINCRVARIGQLCHWLNEEDNLTLDNLCRKATQKLWVEYNQLYLK